MSCEPLKAFPSTVTFTVCAPAAAPFSARQLKTVCCAVASEVTSSLVWPTSWPSTVTVAEPWLEEKGAMMSKPTPVKVKV